MSQKKQKFKIDRLLVFNILIATIPLVAAFFDTLITFMAQQGIALEKIMLYDLYSTRSLIIVFSFLCICLGIGNIIKLKNSLSYLIIAPMGIILAITLFGIISGEEALPLQLLFYIVFETLMYFQSGAKWQIEILKLIILAYVLFVGYFVLVRKKTNIKKIFSVSLSCYVMILIVDIIFIPYTYYQNYNIKVREDATFDADLEQKFELLHDRAPSVRFYALQALEADCLSSHGWAKALPHIIMSLDDPNENVRETAVRVLSTYRGVEVEKNLIKMLYDKDTLVSCAAAQAIGSLDSTAASVELVKVCEQKLKEIGELYVDNTIFDLKPSAPIVLHKRAKKGYEETKENRWRIRGNEMFIHWALNSLKTTKVEEAIPLLKRLVQYESKITRGAGVEKDIKEASREILDKLEIQR